MANMHHPDDLQTCDFCGLIYRGSGYSPDDESRFCCYGCHLVDRILGSRAEDKAASWTLTRLWAGAFLSMNVMMLSLVLYFNSTTELDVNIVNALRWAIAILATPAMMILSGPYLIGSVKDLKRYRLSSDALILTGALSAFGVSLWHVIRGSGHIYFDTATMLLLIVTLGRFLEASAKSRASRLISEMMVNPSAGAHVLRGSVEVEVPYGEMKLGDIMVIRPGERILADGRVVDGRCMLDTSMLTGESHPTACQVDDEVFSGSINCDGLISVEVTSLASDSLMAQIRQMAYRAQHNRPRFELLAEKTALIFVPVIWVLAIAAGLYWGVWSQDYQRAGMSALAILVVACPCAFGVATPMATSLAIGKAYRAGVLICSGELFERLQTVRKVFFDKTGTLTENRLTVSSVYTAAGIEVNDALAWIASVEHGSEHSAAKAIMEYVKPLDFALGAVCGFHAISGEGVEGIVTLVGITRKVTVGSRDMLMRNHIIPDDMVDIAGNDTRLTNVYAGWDGSVQVVIEFDDQIKAEAKELIESLKKMGIESAIISGDSEGPTRRLAEELDVSEIYFGCSPQEKAELIRSKKAEFGVGIAVVGDGINDAVALSAADVGITVESGSDLARESSGVILHASNISRISWLISLSKTTVHIVRQNLMWAFGYNSVAVILAFMGFIHPLIAAVIMVLSSLFVTANSMRLLRVPADINT
ncbi:MAG: heavy metal translocating P-type ATPase [Armatimonadota bacterium]